MMRKYNTYVKLYDFNDKNIITLFDIKPLLENKQIICFSNKSLSKIYFCIDFIKKIDFGYTQSRFYLIQKSKIDKNLDITKHLNIISRLCYLKDFYHQDFVFNIENYSLFLSKLNKIKNS